ncbi:type II toxin-antitoxin system PemK/MazF family toxin [Nocardioides lijunqiniae]|uniref:type II toxin-antitoxin system PemK/MazF family toxin n=1 Tax=Nocardioides lijunqiniae TaxID=2760832 RepID=UPI001877BF7C|nr:type II toxin-antitoxin system PemK/MazF family toxin [Nocardioides lijunqiniae]
MSATRRLLAALRPILRPRGPVSTTVPAEDRAGADGGTGAEGIGYAPRADGLPDPGEVVWAWVPYEEDASRGKDRPALLIGRRGGQLLGLMLTSKDHDRDAQDEARHGRHWMDVGSGGWDREGRPSEVRLDRLLVLDPSAVRREGAALDRQVFDAVVSAAARFHPGA